MVHNSDGLQNSFFSKLDKYMEKGEQKIDKMYDDQETAVKSGNAKVSQAFDAGANKTAASIDKAAQTISRHVENYETTLKKCFEKVSNIKYSEKGKKSGNDILFIEKYDNSKSLSKVTTKLKKMEKDFEVAIRKHTDRITDIRDEIGEINVEDIKVNDLVEGLYDTKAVKESSKAYIAELEKQGKKVNAEVRAQIENREKLYSALQENDIKKKQYKAMSPSAKNNELIAQTELKETQLMRMIQYYSKKIGDTEFSEKFEKINSINITEFESGARQSLTAMFEDAEALTASFGELYAQFVELVKLYNDGIVGLKNNDSSKIDTAYESISGSVKKSKKEVKEFNEELKDTDKYIKQLNDRQKKTPHGALSGAAKNKYDYANKHKEFDITADKTSAETKWQFVGQMSNWIAQGGNIDFTTGAGLYYEKLLESSAELKQHAENIATKVKENLDSVWNSTSSISVPKEISNPTVVDGDERARLEAENDRLRKELKDRQSKSDDVLPREEFGNDSEKERFNRAKKGLEEIKKLYVDAKNFIDNLQIEDTKDFWASNKEAASQFRDEIKALKPLYDKLIYESYSFDDIHNKELKDLMNEIPHHRTVFDQLGAIKKISSIMSKNTDTSWTERQLKALEAIEVGWNNMPFMSKFKTEFTELFELNDLADAPYFNQYDLIKKYRDALSSPSVLNENQTEQEIEEIVKDEKLASEEAQKFAKTIAENFGVKSKSIIEKLGLEIDNILMQLKEVNNIEDLDDEFAIFYNTPNYNNILNILAEDANVASMAIGDVFDDYDKLRAYVSKSTIKNDPAFKNEFGDDWLNVRNIIGSKVIRNDKGTDIMIFLEELNGALGTTFDISTSAEDGIRQLYDALADGQQGKISLISSVLSKDGSLEYIRSLFEDGSMPSITDEIVKQEEEIGKLEKRLSRTKENYHLIRGDFSKESKNKEEALIGSLGNYDKTNKEEVLAAFEKIEKMYIDYLNDLWEIEKIINDSKFGIDKDKTSVSQIFDAAKKAYDDGNKESAALMFKTYQSRGGKKEASKIGEDFAENLEKYLYDANQKVIDAYTKNIDYVKDNGHINRVYSTINNQKNLLEQNDRHKQHVYDQALQYIKESRPQRDNVQNDFSILSENELYEKSISLLNDYIEKKKELETLDKKFDEYDELIDAASSNEEAEKLQEEQVEILNNMRSLSSETDNLGDCLLEVFSLYRKNGGTETLNSELEVLDNLLKKIADDANYIDSADFVFDNLKMKESPLPNDYIKNAIKTILDKKNPRMTTLPFTEESSGQLALPIEGVKEASFEILNSQEEIQNEVKETNEVIEGQIGLFEYLNQQESSGKLKELQYLAKNNKEWLKYLDGYAGGMDLDENMPKKEAWEHLQQAAEKYYDVVNNPEKYKGQQLALEKATLLYNNAYQQAKLSKVADSRLGQHKEVYSGDLYKAQSRIDKEFEFRQRSLNNALLDIIDIKKEIGLDYSEEEEQIRTLTKSYVELRDATVGYVNSCNNLDSKRNEINDKSKSIVGSDEYRIMPLGANAYMNKNSRIGGGDGYSSMTTGQIEEYLTSVSKYTPEQIVTNKNFAEYGQMAAYAVRLEELGEDYKEVFKKAGFSEEFINDEHFSNAIEQMKQLAPMLEELRKLYLDFASAKETLNNTFGKRDLYNENKDKYGSSMKDTVDTLFDNFTDNGFSQEEFDKFIRRAGFSKFEKYYQDQSGQLSFMPLRQNEFEGYFDNDNIDNIVEENSQIEGQITLLDYLENQIKASTIAENKKEEAQARQENANAMREEAKIEKDNVDHKIIGTVQSDDMWSKTYQDETGRTFTYGKKKNKKTGEMESFHKELTSYTKFENEAIRVTNRLADAYANMEKAMRNGATTAELDAHQQLIDYLEEEERLIRKQASDYFKEQGLGKEYTEQIFNERVSKETDRHALELQIKTAKEIKKENEANVKVKEKEKKEIELSNSFLARQERTLTNIQQLYDKSVNPNAQKGIVDPTDLQDLRDTYSDIITLINSLKDKKLTTDVKDDLLSRINNFENKRSSYTAKWYGATDLSPKELSVNKDILTNNFDEFISNAKLAGSYTSELVSRVETFKNTISSIQSSTGLKSAKDQLIEFRSEFTSLKKEQELYKKNYGAIDSYAKEQASLNKLYKQQAKSGSSDELTANIEIQKKKVAELKQEAKDAAIAILEMFQAGSISEDQKIDAVRLLHDVNAGKDDSTAILSGALNDRAKKHSKEIYDVTKQYEKLGYTTHEITDKFKELDKAQTDVEKSSKDSADVRLEKELKYQEELNKLKVNASKIKFGEVENDSSVVKDALNKTQQMISNLQSKDIDGYDKLFEKAQIKVEALNNELSTGSISVENYTKKIQGIANNLDNVIEIIDTDNVDVVQEVMHKYAQSLGTISKEEYKTANGVTTLKVKFEEQNGEVGEAVLQFNQADKALRNISNTTKTVTSSLQSFMNSLKGRAKALVQYLMTFASFYEIVSWIRQGVSVIRELDSALTEMRKVSDETTQSLKNFQKVSFDIADSIGTTSAQIQNSAADFMRLGYSLQEASTLAKDANIYANVGDMEIDEATEHMISSIKAWESEFSSEVEASAAIVDRYNEIGNNFAISSADIGSAMERSAAALKAGGNTLNESLGLITAGNIIQQDAETTAAALKILSLRIRGSKADLEEMGESTDGLITSTSKLREQIKGLTGVDIMLNDSTYKSTAQIIQELGAVYNQLDDIQQANLLEVIAGEKFCLKFVETHFYRTHLIARIA